MRTVKSSVMKNIRGLCPVQHLVAISKNCSMADTRTDLQTISISPQYKPQRLPPPNIYLINVDPTFTL